MLARCTAPHTTPTIRATAASSPSLRASPNTPNTLNTPNNAQTLHSALSPQAWSFCCPRRGGSGRPRSPPRRPLSLASPRTRRTRPIAPAAALLTTTSTAVNIRQIAVDGDGQKKNKSGTCGSTCIRYVSGEKTSTPAFRDAGGGGGRREARDCGRGGTILFQYSNDKGFLRSGRPGHPSFVSNGWTMQHAYAKYNGNGQGKHRQLVQEWS